MHERWLQFLTVGNKIKAIIALNSHEISIIPIMFLCMLNFILLKIASKKGSQVFNLKLFNKVFFVIDASCYKI
jgi:hypothetical protein